MMIVFRELIQNSDDAQARHVEIRFETKGFSEKCADRKSVDIVDDPSLNIIGTHDVSCWKQSARSYVHGAQATTGRYIAVSSETMVKLSIRGIGNEF